MGQYNDTATPEFLVKTTLGISLVSMCLIIPFCINNFYQNRHLLGLFTVIIVILCAINARLCSQNKYNIKINLLSIAPVVGIAIVYAVYTLGVAGSYWPYLGVIVFYFVLPVKPATIVNIIFILALLPVAWNVLELYVFVRFTAVLIGLTILGFISTKIITNQYYSLKEKVVIDSLTGLYNRSQLQSSLEHAIHQYDRANTAMTLLMLDVDHFKKINDDYGHAKGDSVLKSLGEFLTKYFRGSDMVFRIGGEEIMVLIHNSDKTTGLKVAENLRKKIEKLTLISGHTVTVSIGVSNLKPGVNWEQWMKLCDENLYRAKSGGRNLVVG